MGKSINIDLGFKFIPGQTDLPGFDKPKESNLEQSDSKKHLSFDEPQNVKNHNEPKRVEVEKLAEDLSDEKYFQNSFDDTHDENEDDNTATSKNFLSEKDYELKNDEHNDILTVEEITTEYFQEDFNVEEVTETVEISILDDLDELINEIQQQNVTKAPKTESQRKQTEESVENPSLSNVENELNALFSDVLNLNSRDPGSQLSRKDEKKERPQRKQRPRKTVPAKAERPTSTEKYVTTTTDSLSVDEKQITNEVSSTTLGRRKPKQRKRPPRNKQKFFLTTVREEESTIQPIVGPQTLEDSPYELYTEKDSNPPSTTTPDFFFGININL